jgi:hypothetical protein
MVAAAAREQQELLDCNSKNVCKANTHQILNLKQVLQRVRHQHRLQVRLQGQLPVLKGKVGGQQVPSAYMPRGSDGQGQVNIDGIQR